MENMNEQEIKIGDYVKLKSDPNQEEYNCRNSR